MLNALCAQNLYLYIWRLLVVKDEQSSTVYHFSVILKLDSCVDNEGQIELTASYSFQYYLKWKIKDWYFVFACKTYNLQIQNIHMSILSNNILVL